MMSRKYGLVIKDEIIHADLVRLINQTWKLIPLREEGKDWKKQLYIILIEIIGLKEIFSNELNFLELIAKLEGMLDFDSIPFSIYRKNVFDCLNLMAEVDKAYG